MDVPTACLLCGSCNETTCHIFFECDYSLSVWNGLLVRSGLNPPPSLLDIVAWLSSPRITGKLRTMIHLIFQASIYHIWKERNCRLHSNVLRPSQQILKDIVLQMRSKLFSLDRETRPLSRPPNATSSTRQQQQTYLSIWFDRVQV